jgi:hypothetical protein
VPAAEPQASVAAEDPGLEARLREIANDLRRLVEVQAVHLVAAPVCGSRATEQCDAACERPAVGVLGDLEAEDPVRRLVIGAPGRAAASAPAGLGDVEDEQAPGGQRRPEPFEEPRELLAPAPGVERVAEDLADRRDRRARRKGCVQDGRADEPALGQRASMSSEWSMPSTQ